MTATDIADDVLEPVSAWWLSGTPLEAEVSFFVHRDGSVTDLQFIRRSGNFAFDLEAQGAVEAASRAGGFGALPAGYGPDMLPVSFFFSPRSLR